MALPLVIESLDMVGTELAEYYALQDDGSYRLQIDGEVKTADEVAGLYKALEAERNLHREAARKLRQFEGIDPEAARRVLQDAAPGDVVEAGLDNQENPRQENERQEKLDEILERAVTAENALADLMGKYNLHLMGNVFANTKAIAELCHDGMQPETVRRVLAPHVSVEDGEVVFRDARGEVILDQDGLNDPEHAIRKLLTETACGQALLRPVNGAGTRPGSVAQGGDNPWKKETFNLTEQGRLLREKPQLARRLAGEAGLSLNG